MNYLLIKRVFDIILSIILLLIFLPIFFIICIGIILSSKGNPIFYQDRIGYDAKIFTIIKFRTMYISKPRKTKQTFLDSPDIFVFGKFLRRFKLDELPQIINILKGDMSFIGPRPCEISIYENMPDWAKERFSLKPGISGLAQIKGGYKISWKKRWIIDLEYLKKISFKTDFLIFIRTFYAILIG